MVKEFVFLSKDFFFTFLLLENKAKTCSIMSCSFSEESTEPECFRFPAVGPKLALMTQRLRVETSTLFEQTKQKAMFSTGFKTGKVKV